MNELEESQFLGAMVDGSGMMDYGCILMEFRNDDLGWHFLGV